MTEFLAVIGGTLLGAIAALGGSLFLAHRADRRDATGRIVEEFFSDGFLAHRISVSVTRRKLDADKIGIEEIARGYWFPGSNQASYKGDDYLGLNEHQHIEAYLGFLIKAEYLAKKGRVDVGELSATLGMPMQYHMQVLREVSAEAARQAEAADANVPNWTRAASYVDANVVGPAFA